MIISTHEKRAADIELVREVGQVLYGPSWQTPFAEALGISRRAVSAWAAGANAPQPRHWQAIEQLVEQRASELAQIGRKIQSLSPGPRARLPLAASRGVKL